MFTAEGSAFCGSRQMLLVDQQPPMLITKGTKVHMAMAEPTRVASLQELAVCR
jgi:hypothetical protein